MQNSNFQTIHWRSANDGLNSSRHFLVMQRENPFEYLFKGKMAQNEWKFATLKWKVAYTSHGIHINWWTAFALHFHSSSFSFSLYTSCLSNNFLLFYSSSYSLCFRWLDEELLTSDLFCFAPFFFYFFLFATIFVYILLENIQLTPACPKKVYKWKTAHILPIDLH